MKRNRRRRVRPFMAALRRTSRVTLFAGAIVAAGAGLVRALDWAKHHPYFAVREIEVEGRAGLDPATVLGWAEVAPGMSVWDVDERRAEERLLTHPRILAASVERRLPNQVRVHVEERHAVAMLFAAQPLLVAADGVAFPPEAADPLAGLPYVTGVGADDSASPRAAERLRRAARFVSLWQSHEKFPALSEIRADAEETTAFPSGPRVAVRFGAAPSVEEFARLEALLELWHGRETQLAAIDLSLPGQAIVRLRHAKRASGWEALRVAGGRGTETVRALPPARPARGAMDAGGDARRRSTTT